MTQKQGERDYMADDMAMDLILGLVMGATINIIFGLVANQVAGNYLSKHVDPNTGIVKKPKGGKKGTYDSTRTVK